MKKKFFSLLAGFIFAVSLGAQTPADLPPLAVKGEISIDFRTRTQRDGDQPKLEVDDVYTLRVAAAGEVLFDGTINHRPFVKNTFSSNQAQNVTYNIGLIAISPKFPGKEIPVGKIIGTVPVNEFNVYDYNAGNVRAAVESIGRAAGFESKMAGQSAAKPPAKTSLGALVDKAKERISITKGSGSSKASISVVNYDKMDFTRFIIPAGPVAGYSEATVDGVFLYDYDRSSWYLQDIVVTYAVKGQVLRDRLTGNIRWNEKTGRYDFDVRVNEGMNTGTTESMFNDKQSAPSVEDFFAVDNTVAALTGTATYKDTKTGGIISKSAVNVDLTSNKLTKEQVVYLTKLLLIANIVPLSSE
jgi:hypothetical protein